MGNMIILIIWLAVQIFCAIEFDQIAKMKGHHTSAYLWFSLLTGPAGWVMVAALPDRAE